jgi:hypothetical protein
MGTLHPGAPLSPGPYEEMIISIRAFPSLEEMRSLLGAILEQFLLTKILAGRSLEAAIPRRRIMRHLFLTTCLSLSAVLGAGPVEDLLASRHICLASGQILRIPAGTALPVVFQAQHPLAQIHQADQAGLSLVCDLFVRGGDGYVSLDGSTWMSFETALAALFPGLKISTDGGVIVLGLPA